MGKHREQVSHDLRVKVWEDTRKKCKTVYKAIEPPPSIKFSHLELDIEPRFEQTKIQILEQDCLDVGMALKLRKYNPVILNMCDWAFAGGFVDSGSGAQEEELFRRTNYYQTLKKDLYPLKETDTIYSKNVWAIKMGAKKKYLPTKPVRLNFIAAPAPNCPELKDDQIKDPEVVEQFKEKIRMVLRVAYVYNHDIVVLSAWGCGAFRCPPYQVAELFRDIIPEFAGAFQYIIFAITGGKNYTIFREVICQEIATSESETESDDVVEKRKNRKKSSSKNTNTKTKHRNG